MSDAIRAAVERARRGDRKAFGQIVQNYQRRVYSTAFRVVGNHEDADDVVQEAFVRAYRGIGGFDQRADFFTWLYRIVINVSINQLRKRRRKQGAIASSVDPEQVRLTVEQQRSAGGDPSRALELKRLVADIGVALDGLSEAVRASFVLVVFDGLSYRQAAEILECSEGTLAWRIHEGRRRLREELAKYLGSTEVEEDARAPAKGVADAR